MLFLSLRSRHANRPGGADMRALATLSARRPTCVARQQTLGWTPNSTNASIFQESAAKRAGNDG